jgi:cysteine desulfurase/selenocysteine lyase
MEAVESFYTKHNANIHRGIHSLSEEATELYREAREKVAGFVGATAEEMIFVRNATEGINLVTWTWAFDHINRGEEILITEMEHHSNLVPWMQLAESRGVKVRFANVGEDGILDKKDFERKLSKKTKLVAVVHCSNVTGVINPIEEITRKAKKLGVKVLVDAAQSVQHIGIDVSKVGCDFMVFSGHKMLGPMGIGGLYIRRKRMAEMGPFLTGGGMISEVYKDRVVWADGVDKFEAGTPNVSGAIGLAAAVEYHEKLGLENIRKHEKELTRYLLQRLKEVKEVRVVGPLGLENRGGVVSFVVDGVHAHDVAQVLDYKMGVAVRSGHHCVMPLHKELGLAATTRASFYMYNERNDVDKLIEGLLIIRGMFVR